MEEIYDVVILGAGPAGLSAGLYAGRSQMDALILERGQDGGQIAITDSIENYPGQAVQGEPGPELVARMAKQAEGFGAKRASDSIQSVELNGDVKVLHGVKQDYKAHNVIIASGAHARPIGCENEGVFTGKGVSYCATCDGGFYKNKITAVVGGGDVALEDAIYLSRICKKVYVIHRRDEFRGAKILADKVKALENIEILWNTTVERLNGSQRLESVEIRNKLSEELSTLSLDGLFIAVGTVPNSAVAQGTAQLDSSGYIIADESCKTSADGIFAAGDVRTKQVRQVITAAADGACAVYSAEKYLAEMSF